MSRHADSLRLLLARGPMTARQLIDITGLSQSTVSRTLRLLGDEIIRVSQGLSVHYASRDYARGFADAPVYRTSEAGKICLLGTLIPVRPDGFVMVDTKGETVHSDSLPWWMFDMRPQGFLGRAYASTHAANLGLPANPEEWNDSHAVRALLAHGHDVVGNILLGERARDNFTAMAEPVPLANRAEAFPRFAVAAASGQLPGSSAGGEQPKFACYTDRGHVLVKFSAADDNLLAQRWRDLLLAEHLALEVLGVTTQVFYFGNQRFLEVLRFDRVGAFGRVGLFSLKALDLEFVGAASRPWPVIVDQLAVRGIVQREAVAAAARLWAFGILIGNTDMHTGNLSFISSDGRPYRLAPAYDMLPMAFSPTRSGQINDTLAPANLTAVDGGAWREALVLARLFMDSVRMADGLSAGFGPCISALEAHIADAAGRIARLA